MWIRSADGRSVINDHYIASVYVEKRGEKWAVVALSNTSGSRPPASSCPG